MTGTPVRKLLYKKIGNNGSRDKTVKRGGFQRECEKTLIARKYLKASKGDPRQEQTAEVDGGTVWFTTIGGRGGE